MADPPLTGCDRVERIEIPDDFHGGLAAMVGAWYRAEIELVVGGVIRIECWVGTGALWGDDNG